MGTYEVYKIETWLVLKYDCDNNVLINDCFLVVMDSPRE